MYNPIRSDVLNLSNSDRDGLRGKKIAIVANCSWNIYNFRLNIINELICLGAHVLIITPFDEYTSKLSSINSITLIELKHLRRSSLNPIIDLLFLKELYRIYYKHKPDCILHYTIKPNIYGALAAKILHVPTISMVTGLGYTFLHNGILNHFVKWMYKIALRYPKKVIFENKDDKALFVSSNLVNVLKTFHVNGCGVNLEYFSPVKNKMENEPVRFSFIGRLLYDKGIIEFIIAAHKILEEYPQIKFTIVGFLDEDNPSHLNQKDLQDLLVSGKIEYKTKKEDIRPEIALSDCIVLPSYREGMPKILMEAMSMAKPIITTDTAGCRDLVEEGQNGYLVKPKDVDSLVNALIRIIKLTPEERNIIGYKGRKKAETELCDKLIASQITKHLAEIL